MIEVTFAIQREAMKASVELGVCSNKFLLLTCVACLQALAKKIGREGALEQLERGFHALQ